jgi:hypothetical protein
MIYSGFVKKDITLSELNACERLLEYTKDASDDKEVIEREIAELKMTLIFYLESQCVR